MVTRRSSRYEGCRGTIGTRTGRGRQVEGCGNGDGCLSHRRRPHLYSTSDGSVRLEVVYQDETFWLSQKRMAELFGVDVRTVSEHFQNIFRTGELDQRPAIRKFRTTTADGKAYETQFYHLDAIIAVGYRVNSRQATQFRIWATQTLREYIIKGFVLDDERLKQGSRSARTTSTNCWSGSARFGPASGASI